MINNIRAYRITVFDNINRKYLFPHHSIRPITTIIGAALKNFSLSNEKNTKLLNKSYLIKKMKLFISNMQDLFSHQ